jgi:hypothetical protein
MIRFIKLCATMLIVLLPTVTTAGSSTPGQSILPQAEVATFANRVQQDLASRGASVAIVARMGRHPAQMPNGILYTHLGLWVYSQITSPDGSKGQGCRVYNLYQRSNDRTRSDLIQDSPAEFLWVPSALTRGSLFPIQNYNANC